MEPYQKLEQEFAKWLSIGNTVGVSSGTSALQVGIAALKLPQGCSVIVPEFTMIACPRACTMAGMRVYPVDCDDNLLLDFNKLEELPINDEIRAIMVVHIYGRIVDMERLHRFAERKKLFVIEDLAEAHGIKPHPKTDVACWSFYKNKIVAGEEGGMIAFKNDFFAERAKSLRSLGFTGLHDFFHIPGGTNARLSNVHASLILKSLEDVEHNLSTRRLIRDTYYQYIPEAYLPPTPSEIPWVFDLRVKRMPKIVKLLNAKGIPARQGFKPVSSQHEYYRNDRQNLNATRLAQEVMYLPIDPRLTVMERQVIDIAEAFKECAASLGV